MNYRWGGGELTLTPAPVRLWKPGYVPSAWATLILSPKHLTVTCDCSQACTYMVQPTLIPQDWFFKIVLCIVDLHMSDIPHLLLLLTGWSVEEVNQQFLERAGLGYMAEQFYVNKINGKCLMLLNEVS